MPEPLGCQQITFTARPIETAPKDKEIMLFQGKWFLGRWFKTEAGGWWEDTRGVPKVAPPTHWADPEEMKPR